MGYESRFYIVRKSTAQSNNTPVWAEVIAMFDMCKAPQLSEPARKYPPTNCYIYSDDDNTKITEDKYGKPLTEIPIADMIEIVERAVSEDSFYRRYTPFLNLLKSFDLKYWGNLVVLHYGY